MDRDDIQKMQRVIAEWDKDWSESKDKGMPTPLVLTLLVGAIPLLSELAKLGCERPVRMTTRSGVIGLPYLAPCGECLPDRTWAFFTKVAPLFDHYEPSWRGNIKQRESDHA